jgi:iron(III) transport system permease protein
MISTRTLDSRKWLLFAATAVVLLFIGYPLVQLVLKSLPLANYLTQLSEPLSYHALLNTLYISVGITLLATSIGSLLAFLIIRTDLPLKRLVRGGIYLLFLTPSYVSAMAWIQLFGRAGYITRWLREALGFVRPPWDLYTLEGVILVMGLNMIPIAYMATATALRNADPAREEASIMSGASSMRTFWSVTVPLALPGILAGAFLVFVHGVSGFGVPAMMAMSSGHLVLTTRIYAALGHYDVRMACALSVFLVALIALVLWIHNAILRRNRFGTSASSSRSITTYTLGHWRWPTTATFLVFFALFAMGPLAMIGLSSLLKAWGLPIAWSNLTIGNYRSIFSVGVSARALRNSFLFAAGGATCASILGLAISYIVQRTQFRGRRILDFLATVPLAVPGPVIAASMIFAWTAAPLQLYNTPWIILVAYTVAFVPYTVRTISGVLKSMQESQEEAGWLSGGSWARVFANVVFPVVRRGVWAGWMLVFLMAFREIPISTMLYTQGTETVGVLMFILKTEAGGLEVVSAVAIIVLILTAIGQLLVGRLAGIRKGIL